MKNIFSSPALQDFQKFIIKQLDYLLNEQKHQRADLAQILRLLHKQKNTDNAQKQVDEFYENSPEPPEDTEQD